MFFNHHFTIDLWLIRLESVAINPKKKPVYELSLDWVSPNRTTKMNLISLNSLVCLTLFILLFNQVMECKLDKKSFCYCKPMGDDEETSSNLKKINFVNYIVSLGKLSWSLDFFTGKWILKWFLCKQLFVYTVDTIDCTQLNHSLSLSLYLF